MIAQEGFLTSSQVWLLYCGQAMLNDKLGRVLQQMGKLPRFMDACRLGCLEDSAL